MSYCDACDGHNHRVVTTCHVVKECSVCSDGKVKSRHQDPECEMLGRELERADIVDFLKEQSIGWPEEIHRVFFMLAYAIERLTYHRMKD